MKKETVRRQFHIYRERIAQLEEHIRDMEYQQEESYFAQEEAIGRANKRAESCRREAEERERQAESDRWYREDQLRRATQDLDRAISYGDEWGIERAKEKIKKASYY